MNQNAHKETSGLNDRLGAPLKLRPGDRVKLTARGPAYYGGNAHWVPEGQGGGKPGTVILAKFRGENKPGADPRPYMVRWDNGVVNSYREEDLESA